MVWNYTLFIYKSLMANAIEFLGCYKMRINTHMVVNFIVLINKYNLNLYCMIFFYEDVVLLVLH